METSVNNQIEEFFSQYKTRTYPKGQILIMNGDETEFVFNLVEGKVKQYDITYRGDEIVLNVFKPPAFFPMSLAINKSANPYIYEAETSVKVRQAPVNEVIKFVKTNSDVLFDLLSRVYRGVDGLIGLISLLRASSAKGRLMYELLIECRRFGKPNSDGKYSMAIKEKDLASRAGLSRETVSREMTKLVNDKFVTVKPNQITINNVRVFEEKLGQVI